MAPQCSSRRPSRLEVLVVALASVLVLSLLAVSCRETKSHPRAREVDSKDLKQTVVVATLDCPLPEHKNAIWCSTFQMAWDKLKQDIIGEPIQIPTAQELADRLNRSQFPAGSIDEKSYYATAGSVKNGIIEQIQKEMRHRFPSEPVPTFDSRYKTLPDVIVAYAFLNVDVAFQFPYYTYQSAFDFQSSAGERARVTAFGTQTSGHSKDRMLVYGQVEVLYYDSGELSGGPYFAVDLSRRTQPYQVMLARMPRGNTLGETTKMLQDKITAFKSNPNYQTLGSFEYGDTLIVPDVLYKLTHHFDELLNKPLGNQKWSAYDFFEALQKIDFTLSRTGVILKSEARLGAKSAAVMKPRHLHFDRPFLICVQKREPNATPFFLMWVDNAELMQPYASER